MDRVFLDANVLFSASYRDDNRLLELWSLSELELVTSSLAANEALQNLAAQAQCERLRGLLGRMRIVPEPTAERSLPQGVDLPANDALILLAAIGATATHFITGDKRHFGSLFGQIIEGVAIQRPSAFLAERGVP